MKRPLNLPCPNCGRMCRVGTARWVSWLGEAGAWNLEEAVPHECRPGLTISIVLLSDGRLVAFGTEA